jgi:Arabinose efflux permease
MVFYITLTTFAVYSADRFNTSPSIAGLTASIFVIGAVLGRLIGRGRWLRPSITAFFVLTLMYLVPIGLIPLLILRVLHGIAFGMAHNALSTVVVEFIPQERRGEGIGYFSLNFVIATALGPFIGILVTQHWSYAILFILCAFSALAGLILALLIPKADASIHKPSRALFIRSAIPMAIVIILMSMCYTSVTTFVEAYASELGFAKAAPFFFVVYAVVILLVRPLAGKLLDRRGDNIVMVPAILFFGISLLILAFARSISVFLLAALLMAPGYGNILNIGQAIAVKVSPKESVGTTTSTYFSFSDTGMGLGPLIMGLLVSWKGFTSTYLVTAGVCVVTLALYWFLHGKHAR